MKELANTSNILNFFMEYKILLGSNIHLAIIWNWFFGISMLLYGKMLKCAERSHFLADFGHVQKMFWALKFEPLEQTTPNFERKKEKIFLTGGEKDNSIQHHIVYKKWQKHGVHFTPKGL